MISQSRYFSNRPQTGFAQRRYVVGDGSFVSRGGAVEPPMMGNEGEIVQPQGQSAPAKLIVENRPVEPGIYFMQVNLPSAMSAVQAREYFKAVRPPENAEYYATVSIRDYNLEATGKFLMPEALNGLLAGISSGALTPEYLQNVKASEEPIILGSGDTITAIAYYMLVKQKMNAPSGLSDQIAKSYYNAQGQLIKEVDADGREWSNTTVGVFPLIPILGIAAAFLAIFAAVAVGYIIYKAVKVGKEWVDLLLDKLGTTGASIVGGLAVVGALAAGFLLWRLFTSASAAPDKPRTKNPGNARKKKKKRNQGVTYGLAY